MERARSRGLQSILTLGLVTTAFSIASSATELDPSCEGPLHRSGGAAEAPNENLVTMRDALRRNAGFHWVPDFPRDALNLFDVDVSFAGPRDEDALVEYLVGSSVNLALRGHHDVHFMKVPLEPFATRIQNLDRALTRLPAYAGVCFRGESFAAATLLTLRPGDVLEDPGYASCSLDVTKAKSFEARFAGLESTLLVIHSDRGRVVPARFYHRREWEILFPRNGRRRVLAIDREIMDRPVIYVTWE